jgi:hypothetical protein
VLIFRCLVDADVFEEVVVPEVLVRSFAVVSFCDVHVVRDEGADALAHFVLTCLVVCVLHFWFFVFRLLRLEKIESQLSR